MDPYKVLGVTPQTSDDDVKRAYRELARKYHPDNYVNNPLADLAETRMKEINEAYDMIMNERRNPAGGSSGQQQSYGGAYNGQQYGGYQQRTYTGANAALYSQVRQAINQGNLGMAEALLQRAAGRDAEWFYLTGTVYYRKGWYDEAARAYTQACQMDPNNAEYQHALQNLHLSGGYARDRPRRTSGSGGHGVAVFRRCDAADRTGGLPDSRCGLSNTAAAPREHKNGWAAVPRHLGTGTAADTAQADRGGLCAAVRPVPDREISDRVPSAGLHAAERQAGVF